MENFTIPDDAPWIKVSLNNRNGEEVCRKLVEVIRPRWNPGKISIKSTSSGFLNQVLFCYSDERQDHTDAIVVKNLSKMFCGPVLTSQKQHLFLFQHGLGPRILALFDNGFVSEMIIGESFEWESPRAYDDDFREKMAEEMARYHSRKLYEDAKFCGMRHVRPSLVRDFENYWEEILNGEKYVHMKNIYPTAPQLHDAMRDFEEEMLKTNDLDETVIHSDFNCGNIFLSDMNKNGVITVDFDFLGIGYLQYDLAWFFRAFKEATESGSDHIPGRDYEIKFMQHYIKHRNKLDGKPEPEEEDVQRLYRQVQKAKVMMHIRLIVIVTFITHFNPQEELPGIVQDSEGGIEKFKPICTRFWSELPEYKKRVFARYN